MLLRLHCMAMMADGNFFYGNWAPPALGTYTLKVTP